MKNATVQTWRFTTGAHMDGVRRTNASAFRRGTRPIAQNGRLTLWSRLSRAERAGLRMAVTTGLPGTGMAYLTHPEATTQTMAGAGAAATLAAGYGTAQFLGQWSHQRNWIHPLHLVLEKPLGLPDGTRPQSYLKIPRDYPRRTDVGRIELPPAYAGENRAAVASLVKEKLGLTDVSVTFHMKGRRPYAELKQTPRPRAKALFAEADIRALVEKAADDAPLIGVGPQASVVCVSFDDESPHVLVSASTGGGKSVIARGMTTQALHHGGQALVLDRKRISHKWARGLPQVHYARDMGEIHDALVWLGTELERRTRITDEWEGEENEAPVGPRLVVVLEEVNATVSRLKKYWGKVKEKGDDKDSPAIDALGDTLFMGRAIKINVIAVGQSITAQAIGGPEMRECFGTRILARFTRNAWNMLVPEVTPIPRSSRHVGRAQVVLGGTATETQVAFFSEKETREWAMSGIVAPALDIYGAGRHAEPVTRDTEAEVPTSQTLVTGSVTPQRDTLPAAPRLTLVKGGPDAVAIPPKPSVPPQVRRYTLAEAAREAVIPMKDTALRKAKQRDPEFPVSDDGKWTAEELQRWHRNRPTANAAAGE
ncbi:pRL2-11 [Streptomyces sp. MBT57]|nr:pRL2-11 [Streptomyces sp. MBT57]